MNKYYVRVNCAAKKYILMNNNNNGRDVRHFATYCRPIGFCLVNSTERTIWLDKRHSMRSFTRIHRRRTFAFTFLLWDVGDHVMGPDKTCQN